MKRRARRQREMTDQEIIEKTQGVLDDLLAYLGIAYPVAGKSADVDRDSLRAALIELEEDIIEREIHRDTG